MGINCGVTPQHVHDMQRIVLKLTIWIQIPYPNGLQNSIQHFISLQGHGAELKICMYKKIVDNKTLGIGSLQKRKMQVLW